MKYNNIKEEWNRLSDEANNWDNISTEEQVEFAYQLGVDSEGGFTAYGKREDWE